jgi:hypothetical protein
MSTDEFKTVIRNQIVRQQVETPLRIALAMAEEDRLVQSPFHLGGAC